MTCRSRIRIVALLALVALGGCRATHSTGADLAPLPAEQVAVLDRLVHHLLGSYRLDGPNSGSSIALGQGRWLTVRHVLPELAHLRQPDGEPITIPAWLNRYPIEYQVIAAGTDTDVMEEDWALLEVEGGDLGLPRTWPRPRSGWTVSIDPDFEPRPGEVMYLVGFPSSDLPQARTPPLAVRPTVIPARVVAHHADISEAMICLEPFTSMDLHGMSGGAAVRIDEAARRIEVGGVIWGSVRTELLWFTLREIKVARRIPAAVRRSGPEPTVPAS